MLIEGGQVDQMRNHIRVTKIYSHSVPVVDPERIGLEAEVLTDQIERADLWARTSS